jgi:UDP-glucose 4-epimerase
VRRTWSFTKIKGCAMQIMITGVAGFIGSNLAGALIRKGYTVVGVDNMSQGEELNMTELRKSAQFSFHLADVRDEAEMIRHAEGCDSIVHLAAYKIPRYSDALDTLLINSHGSEAVIKAAVKHRCKIVGASTSDVYGKNPNVPFSENHDLVIGRPEVKRWAYAISKMFEEQLFLAYHDRFGIDVVLLRFFGAYGPHQNLTWWGGPQSVFMNCALDDKEIEVHGDGQQTRSFTYITDHIDGIIRAIERPEANNKVLNIGNTREITIEGLARLIWRLVRGDEPAKIRFIPYSTFGNYEDVRRRVPDISRARELLAFAPQVDLEEGLTKTLEWQVKRRNELATGIGVAQDAR